MTRDILGATPLERLEHCLTYPPHNAWMGARPLGVNEADRTVEVGLRVRPQFSLDPKTLVVHGGVLATLIDMTAHAAVAVWHGAVTPTVTLQVDYLAPATAPELVARGMLRKLGRSIARADVEVRAGERLFTLGRGTFSVR